MNFVQTQPPIYVSDVMTDVSDIEIRKTQGVCGSDFPEKSMEYDAGTGSCCPADHQVIREIAGIDHPSVILQMRTWMCTTTVFFL